MQRATMVDFVCCHVGLMKHRATTNPQRGTMMGFSETLISFYKYPAASKGFGTDYYCDFEH
jgi:hypothetical protein